MIDGGKNGAEASESSGRPMRFVFRDEESGKFKIDPDAIFALNQLEGPVAVVSVCGPPLQGKSFLLNQLLRTNTGFQVASTHQPCTSGLWIWSAPLKRTAVDGTEYNLILLDSEGIDAHDQTGTRSTQLFSLVIILSSMFIYNQMGGIEKPTLDRLSLFSEMTKYFHACASEGKETISQIAQFSPVFVWLLRDFVDDNTKVAPRDYLELALRPGLGNGKDVAVINEIRESIQALFQSQECFSLIHPLKNGFDTHHLDRVLFDKLQPEFQSGLDALMKFVDERARPKQAGSVVMTGPVLAGMVKYCLDALNDGAVPTISSLWQEVEESECRRAFDRATEVYVSAFGRAKPLEEASLSKAYDEAVQKSIVSYTASTVGVCSASRKYEALLQNYFEMTFEEYKRTAFTAADLLRSNEIQNMEKKLQEASLASDGEIDKVFMVLDSILSKYEAAVHGPVEWQKLSSFLRQSLHVPILDHSKKLVDKISLEKTAVMLKCRSIEGKIEMLHKQLEESEKLKNECQKHYEGKLELLHKQLEASEKFRAEYHKHYEEAINDLKKFSDYYKSRINDLESKCVSLEERYSSSLEMLDSAKQESLEWRRKYEDILTRKDNVDNQANAAAILKSRIHEMEKRLADAHEQAQLASKEADEWKRKCDFAVNEAKDAMEKEAIAQECSTEQAKIREEALRAEFSHCLAEKDKEIKEKVAKLEEADQRLATLIFDLKAAEAKIDNYDLESSALKLQIKGLADNCESIKSTAQASEGEVQMLVQDRTQQEQKYLSLLKEFEELQEKYKISEEGRKVASKFAETARSEVLSAQNEKTDAQLLSLERLAQIESAQRHIEILEKEKHDLACEVKRSRALEDDALSKVALLEDMVKERDQEIENLKMKCDQRVSSIQVLETTLESEHAEHAEDNRMANAAPLNLDSLQENTNLLEQGPRFLELVQENINLLEQESTPELPKESALSFASGALTPRKHPRLEGSNAIDSVKGCNDDEELAWTAKRAKSITSLQRCTVTEVGNSVFNATEGGSEAHKALASYTKLTVIQLRQILIEHGFSAELLKLKNPRKKDILSLYEKLVLNK